MDDLQEKLNNLLSDPDSMQKIQQMAASLGVPLDGGTSPPAGSPAEATALTEAEATPSADAAGLGGLLSGLGDMGSLTALLPLLTGGNGGGGPSTGLGDLGSLTALLPLLTGGDGGSGGPDHTPLLKALRPYLQGDRQNRLDDAIQIMGLMKFIPLLGGKKPPDKE